MTRDVRIVLLVGLVFIFLFGLVLGDRTLRLSEGSPSRPPAVASGPVRPAPEIAASRMVGIQDPFLARRRPLAPAPGPGHRAAVERADLPVHMTDRALPPPVPLAARVPAADPTGPAPAPRPQTYTAVAGDSLIVIARKLYGRQNQGKYKLIFEANRDRLADENSLKLGQELIIPPLPSDAAPGRATGAAPAAPATRTPDRTYTEATLAELRSRFGSSRWYEVRQGDRLTDIARRQMGSDSVASVRRLYEANRDRIADPDVLAIGLRLRIPQ